MKLNSAEEWLPALLRQKVGEIDPRWRRSNNGKNGSKRKRTICKKNFYGHAYTCLACVTTMREGEREREGEKEGGKEGKREGEREMAKDSKRE